jgi:hypothetical protein
LHGKEIAVRREQTWAALAELDRAIAQGRDPSNAVAFGVLLAPFLPDDVRGGDLYAAMHELSYPLIQQLRVTRRDSERLKFILIGQRKLAHARRRGVAPELGGGRELVDDTTLLHALLERAAGREVGELPEVVGERGDDDAAEGELEGAGDGDQPRKRRRRRRGGRRRSGATPS